MVDTSEKIKHFIERLLDRSCVIITICLLAISCTCYAQTQQGYVKTRGRLDANGKLIPGARLSDVTIGIKGKNSITSGSRGVFSFSVPSKRYYLTKVLKKGYELCDQDILSREYLYSANSIVVVMDNYENILEDKLATEKKIRRSLRKQLQDKEDEIESLKEQQKISEEEYRTQLQDLYALHSNNEKLIADMSDRYSSLDFDQLDEFQRQVASYIQNGELTRADSLLNTRGSMEDRSAELDKMDAALKMDAIEIEKRQEQHQKSLSMKQHYLEQFGTDCVSRFEICKIKHLNDSAAYWLKLRASKDTLNIEWQLAAGKFIADYLANYELAMTYYERSLKIADSKLQANNKSVSACYSLIGNLCYSKGEFNKSLENYLVALEKVVETFGENHLNAAKLYDKIAIIYAALGQYPKAEEYYLKEWNIITNEEDFKALGTYYSNTGAFYTLISNYDKAKDCFSKSLTIHSELYEGNDINLSCLYDNMGVLYKILGEYDQAMTYYKKALQIRVETYGENHPEVALTYSNLGVLYKTIDDKSKALECYQKSMDIRFAVYGSHHNSIADTYNNIAGLFKSVDDIDKAIDYYNKALEIKIFVLGDDHPDIGLLYNNIGSCYKIKQNFDKAKEFYNKAFSCWANTLDESNGYFATYYNNMGIVYCLTQDYDNALEYYSKAIEICRKSYGDKHPNIASTYHNMANVYGLQGNYISALKMEKEALLMYLAYLKKDHSKVKDVLHNIDIIYKEAEKSGVHLPDKYEYFLECSVYE